MDTFSALTHAPQLQCFEEVVQNAVWRPELQWQCKWKQCKDVA
jgi:hypothetical protein